jgi:hypothetical protein
MSAACRSDLGPAARRPDRRTRELRAALLGMLALALMAVGAPAASAAPWACDSTAYVTRYGGAFGGDTTFSKVTVQPDGTAQVTDLGVDTGHLVNSLGFRTQDGLMYAYDNTTQEVVRISNAGNGTPVFTPLPPVIGLPPGFGSIAGVFLADGTYFVWGPQTNPVGYIIDVSGPIPTVVRSVTATWNAGPIAGGGQPIADMAVSPGFSGAQWFAPGGAAGTLYHMSGLNLYATDMATGQLKVVGPLAAWSTTRWTSATRCQPA